MGGGAWWAAAHGVAEGRTWLSDFTFTFHFHAWEKEMATHSSFRAWRIPGTGAWWAAIYGVTQSQTRLKWHSSSSSSSSPKCYCQQTWPQKPFWPPVQLPSRCSWGHCVCWWKVDKQTLSNCCSSFPLRPKLGLWTKLCSKDFFLWFRGFWFLYFPETGWGPRLKLPWSLTTKEEKRFSSILLTQSRVWAGIIKISNILDRTSSTGLFW